MKRDRVPARVGSDQSSCIRLCLAIYRCLRVAFLCFVKSEYPRCPKGCTFCVPSGRKKTASHFLSGRWDFLMVLRRNFPIVLLRDLLRERVQPGRRLFVGETLFGDDARRLNILFDIVLDLRDLREAVL